MKFAFVILHYNDKSLSDTYECIESVKALSNPESCRIVVVENGSGDTSSVNLKKKYECYDWVTILEAEENLGFANGNNLGCQYAIENWNPEFLIVINNDTVIDQSDFLERIEQIYQEYQFHILGPNIRDINDNPQNPVPDYPISLQQLEAGISGMQEKVQALKTGYLYYWLKYKAKKVFRKSVKKILMKSFLKPYVSGVSKVEILSKEIQFNRGLHGAALIFSKKYYELYEHVFYSGTFMFKEEDILYYRVIKHHLSSVYHPDIIIRHKEDRSTDNSFSGDRDKEEFIIKNQLKSFIAFREYIITDQNLKD